MLYSTGCERIKKEYQNYLREQEVLKQQTVDFIQLGEMEPEREHSLKGSNTAVGEFVGRKFRLSWNDGWFTFDMKVTDQTPLQLIMTCCGNDGESCSFDIYIDDKLLRSVTMRLQKSEDLYDMKIDIPFESTSNKDKVKISFKSHKERMIGRIFGDRLIKKM